MAIAYHTDPGAKRPDNQDYVGAFTNSFGRTMVIVADGVTSNEGGEVASAMTVEHLDMHGKVANLKQLYQQLNGLKIKQ